MPFPILSLPKGLPIRPANTFFIDIDNSRRTEVKDQNGYVRRIYSYTPNNVVHVIPTIPRIRPFPLSSLSFPIPSSTQQIYWSHIPKFPHPFIPSLFPSKNNTSDDPQEKITVSEEFTTATPTTLATTTDYENALTEGPEE